MKLVVVGGVAGGASAAARVRRIDANAEIVVFDKGEYVSYSNCSLPYYLGGVVEDADTLVMMTPESFKSKHDMEFYTKMEVLSIDRKAHTVRVRNLRNGEEFDESYDKLVLSPGAKPVRPRSIEGVMGDNVYTLRDVTDAVRLKETLDKKGAENIVVIGGGFIGIETAENLIKAGKKVTLIEAMDQILAPFDHDMVQTLQKELHDNGVDLKLGCALTKIGDGFAVYKKGDEEFEIKQDAVVMTIGVAPETGLAKDAGLEIGITGGIKVNEHFQTSDPDIYAVGDVIESFNMITKQPGRLTLAGPAQRQARAAADHMYGLPHNYKGFIGSSCIRVFDLNGASTGLNERALEKEGYKYDSVMVFSNDKVGIMPNAHYLQLKVLFEVPSGKLLGAQAIGLGEADKRINVIATLITMGGTLEDLKELELCYAPLFSTAKDAVNMAALVGLNVLSGRMPQVHVSEVRKLVEDGAYIIDVREEEEFEQGHIVTAHNIPLSQIRSRLDEIPKDIPVYVHCRSSQRSYYAMCALKGNGFTNIVNISGSFLGISLYEYFDDVKGNRKPIVTAYNFN